MEIEVQQIPFSAVYEQSQSREFVALSRTDSFRPARSRLPAAGCLSFVVVTAFVVSLGFWCEWRAHRQQALIDQIHRFGGSCSTPGRAPIWLHDLVAATLGSEHAAGYTDLTFVQLRQSTIADQDLRCLAGQWRLRSLSLEDTRVTGDGLRHLCGIHLTTLNLDGTPVTDAGLRHLRELHSLKTLFLEDTGVSDAGLAHLARLEELEVLHLGGTRISDNGLRELCGLTRLRWIQLNDTGVTDAGLEYLSDLPRLAFVDLRNTKVTTPGVDQLRWQRPGIGIDR